MTQTAQWDVYGHDWAVEFLRRGMLNQRTRHAYLITGSTSIGKSQLAHAFAQALNCEQDDIALRPCGVCPSCRKIRSGNHPDIIYSELDERTENLKIDTLRDVMKMLALKPFASRYRVAILHDFDHAREQAQDALLKTLEEPPPHAILIVLAQSTDALLSTITSRCQVVPLRPVPQQTVEQYLKDRGADADTATLLARLSSGRIGWATKALENSVIMEERASILDMLHQVVYGNRAVRFDVADQLDSVARKERSALEYALEIWQTYWRDVLLLAKESPVKPCNTDRLTEMQQLLYRINADDALRALQATRQMLLKTMRSNANIRLALEVMFLDYPFAS